MQGGGRGLTLGAQSVDSAPGRSMGWDALLQPAVRLSPYLALKRCFCTLSFNSWHLAVTVSLSFYRAS